MTFEREKQMYTESRLPVLKALPQRALMGIHSIDSLDGMVQPLVSLNNKRKVTFGLPFHDLVSSASDSRKAALPKLEKTGGVTRNYNKYDTDAFEAVSSCQQKYSWTSLFARNELSSQTHSLNTDHNDVIYGEVSVVGNNVMALDFASSSRLLGSSKSSTHSSRLLGFSKSSSNCSSVSGKTSFSMPQTAPVKTIGQSSNMNLRNLKIEDPLQGEHISKKQKISPSDFRDVDTKPGFGIGGWSEESSVKEDPMPATADFDRQKTVSAGPNEVGIVGVSLAPNPWGDIDHLLDGYEDQQKETILKERARRIEEQNNMFNAKKLSLVLDLDHTLLNSAKFSEVDPALDEKLRKMEEIDRDNPQRHLFRFEHMGLWTKMRPGVWNLLERASKLFELHICTMGTTSYATEIAKVLDPTGTLFAGRITSRGEDNHPTDNIQLVPLCKDLNGVLGMESAVVIIDDCSEVWPHNKKNLIIVERYNYFPCSRREFGLPGPSLLEVNRDERVNGGTLASSLSVIERIHTEFFSRRNLIDADVRNILASEQRKILAGCRILFSRIFPVEEANPHLHPLWQIAEQFGAVCTNHVDEQVTHVVANLQGTDKVNWALSTGKFVVQPGWLEASTLLYRRAKEWDFTLKK